ncbi:hypothetical protein F4819DRAFT_421872 [Hypoxylon fuscum]|nr:hypothetical protein F4819DRAFT_421872 [Hypoxylon fuscum]
MLPTLRLLVPFGLLALGVKKSYGSAIQKHYPYYNISSSSVTTSESYNVSSSCTTTTELPPITVSSTTTLTETDCSSSATTISSIITSTTTTTCNTTTISVPSTFIPSTITPTVVPTITTSPVFSSYSTTVPPVYNPCPTTCSIYAGTVNLFFWPTNNDYSYPSTYVDTALDYTFTSPSVYMVINTIYGYNTLGRAGPAASSPIFALDLDQVSSIVPGSGATRQLSLSDLGTDCPQSLDPSEIATKAPDGRCDPSLVAPDVVKSWALPCNACGKFGLFDPPYAVPTLDGGLIGTTTVTPIEETTASATPTTTPAATGASSTAVTATATSTPVPVPTESSAASSAESPTSTLVPVSPASSTSTPIPVTSGTPTITTSGSTTVLSPTSSGSESAPTTVATASATRVRGTLTCLVLSFFVSISLM